MERGRQQCHSRHPKRFEGLVSASKYHHLSHSALAPLSPHSYNTPPCEAFMLFVLRPQHRILILWPANSSAPHEPATAYLDYGALGNRTSASPWPITPQPLGGLSHSCWVWLVLLIGGFKQPRRAACPLHGGGMPHAHLILYFAMYDCACLRSGHDSGTTTSRLRKPVGATVDGPERYGCHDAMVVALTQCRVLREWTGVRAQDPVSDCSVER